jgi:Peptidase family S41
MKSLAIIPALIASSLALGSPISANSNDPAKAWMTPEQVAADIAIAQSAYSRIHPGYTRYASADEMRNAWQGILAKAEAADGMTVGDLYLALNLALTNIRCDHTKAELPDALRKARSGKPLYLPFRWELIEDRGLIETATQGSGLKRGDEILSIDGRALAEISSAIGKYIPVDGFTEWSRISQISSSAEFMGGGVDHFGALLWDVPPEATLEVRGSDGATRSVSVPRIDYTAWRALGREAGKANNFKDAVRFERIGDNAAMLSVDTFVNYRTPVNPQELYRPIFNALREEGRDTLILDLRENGGGSTDASMGLVANLVPDARQFMTEFRAATIDHTPWEGLIGTWAREALNPDPRGFIANEDGSYTLRDGVLEDTGIVEPTDVAFNGKLVILTSKNNSSGSTNILAHLSSRPNTVTIGEKTGGSAEGPTAGVLFFLTLPESGAKLRIPMFRQWNNTESFEEGMGVTPQIDAPMTVKAFIEGRDPALEQAISMVERKAIALNERR